MANQNANDNDTNVINVDNNSSITVFDYVLFI